MFTSLGEAGVSCALLKFLSSAPPLIRSVVSKISSPCMGEENQPSQCEDFFTEKENQQDLCVFSVRFYQDQSLFKKRKATHYLEKVSLHFMPKAFLVKEMWRVTWDTSQSNVNLFIAHTVLSSGIFFSEVQVFQVIISAADHTSLCEINFYLMLLFSLLSFIYPQD